MAINLGRINIPVVVEVRTRDGHLIGTGEGNLPLELTGVGEPKPTPREGVQIAPMRTTVTPAQIAARIAPRKGTLR